MFCLHFYAVGSADNHTHNCMSTHLGHRAGISTFNNGQLCYSSGVIIKQQ